jgi:hypothetical protein
MVRTCSRLLGVPCCGAGDQLAGTSPVARPHRLLPSLPNDPSCGRLRRESRLAHPAERRVLATTAGR